jgi:pilus assembly protein CpaC
LFRSTEFQKDMTELLFIITPRLVKPLPPNYALPTDHFQEPGRTEMLLGGKLEADKPASVATQAVPLPLPATPEAGGFESK